MKRLLFLHQRPGKDQKLGRQLAPHLNPDPWLSFSASKLVGIINNKVLIPGRSNESRLVQGLPKIRFPFLGNDRDGALGSFPTALRTEVEPSHLQNLSPILE